MAQTPNGLQTTDTIACSIQKIDKELNKRGVKRPVMLFVSNHLKTLVNYETRKFCEQSKIVLVTNFPLSIKLLQTCDHTIYGQDKSAWKTLVQRENDSFNEISFVKLLKETNDRILVKEAIVNGFASAEIYPCDYV